MSEGKSERQRRKRAAMRRKRARERAEAAQREAREWDAYVLAAEADEHLQRDEVREALTKARRASARLPSDSAVADVYVRAAERSGDVREQSLALGRLAEAVEPDPRLFAQLAHLCLRAGETERARAAALRARSLLPRRMKDRKAWVSLLRYVEDRVAAGPSSPDAAAGVDPGRAGENGRRPAARTRKTEAAGRAEKEVLAPGTGAGEGPAAPPEAPLPEPAEPSFLDVPVEIAGAVEGLEVLSAPTFSSPEDVELAILAARIRDAQSWERLFAVERARGLLPLSHQEDTVRKVLSTFRGRALLADEVGLGKTIEAGLVLSEYLIRGGVERALVLVPPSLVGQGKEELSSKFSIDARTTEDAAFRSDPARFWSGPGVAVASLATARSPRQRDLVTAAPWDLLVVDEAHALKNAATESHLLVSRITSRFLLLLTATPVENRIEELYNLVTLIRAGQLGGRAAFLRRFSDSKMRRSAAARAEVRALLGQVMVRNTRALSGVHLPPRFARTVLVQPDPAEAERYQRLADALRALGPGGRTRLLLSVLLQEAGSSPPAVRGTLEKVAAGGEHPPGVLEALGPAIRCAARATVTGKGAALLRVLDGAAEPAVVFTRFRATLDFLGATLARAGIRHEKIDGNVPAPLRNEAIERLRRGGGVLLSTEVGAEGLNLQFCHRIVNFDLAWSPMRIEQRIGRVHRIGQDHTVEVVNLCLAGSIEERILGILDDRINLFELVVGEVEMILGYLEDERDFPDLVLEAFADPDADGRERSFARIGDALAAARERYDNVKRFDETFFRNELGA